MSSGMMRTRAELVAELARVDERGTHCNEED